MLSSSYTAKADEGAHEHATADVSLASVDEVTAAAVGRFYVFKGWGAYDAPSRQLRLSEEGLFFVERCPAFGVCLSYRPMLHRLGLATHGSTADVFRYEDEHEAWVDRKLNVIGSGFMHNRYFADMMKARSFAFACTGSSGIIGSLRSSNTNTNAETETEAETDAATSAKVYITRIFHDVHATSK